MAQRVPISAGASGIGLAMAEAFARKGANVRVTDVDEKVLADLPENIVGTLVDASDEVAISLFFTYTKKDWGGLDVVCADAGDRRSDCCGGGCETLRLAEMRVR